MSKFVRIAPYNPRLGFVKQTHTIIKPRPMKFVEASGWYEVDDDIAEAVKEIPQVDHAPFGTKAFLVADTKEAARAMEAEIRRMARSNDEEVVGTPESPIRMSRPGQKATASARGPAPAGRTRTAKPKTEEKPEGSEGSEGEGSDGEGSESDES